ncbi:hypothetical protein STRDD11_01091 [Streptococcus sp. DD11]|nr:hypothetical protein STRDD11_01091 [Streptococcus sp. DD11]
MLNGLHDPNQVRMPDTIAYPQAGQSRILGKSPANKEIGILLQQRQGRLAAKIDIGFIYYHDQIPIGRQYLLQLLQGLVNPGRSIGVGQNNASLSFQIILRPNPEILRQRYFSVRNPIKLGPNLVKSIGQVRKKNRLPAVKESQKGHRQDVVAAITDNELVWRDAQVCCQSLTEAGLIQTGVPAQAGSVKILQRLSHPRTGKIGIFIGINLDKPVSCRLLPRHIGSE